MTNAEVFTKLFGLYATELWAKNEQEFLNWLNADYKATSELTVPLMPLCEWLSKIGKEGIMLGSSAAPECQKLRSFCEFIIYS